MKLWLHMTGAIAAVSVGVVGLTGFTAMRASTRLALESGDQLRERDAASLAALLDTWVQTQAAAIEGWNRPFVASTPALQARLQEALLLAVPAASAVVVVDPVEGRALIPALVEGAEAEVRAADLIARLPISELEEGEVALGSPYWPAGGSGLAVPVVASVAGMPYAVGVELSLASVEGVLASQAGPDRRVALLSADGGPLFGGRALPVESLKPFLGLAVPSFALQLPDEALRGSLAPVPSTRWTVVVYESEASSRRAAEAIRASTAAVMGGSVLLALVVGAIFGRSIVAPVRRLRDASLAIAEGRYALQTPRSGVDEVEDLGRAFQHMAKALQEGDTTMRAQREEILGFNQVLQDKVEERTRELEAATEALVRAGQLSAVGHLSAGLAHELNNPLTAILGLSQIMQVQRPSPMLDALEREAQRAREVVDTWVKWTSDEMGATEEIVDVEQWLRELVERSRPLYLARGLSLVLLGHGDYARVRADRAAIGQGLSHLLGAIAAALPPGGGVALQLDLDSGGIVLLLKTTQLRARIEAGEDWRIAGRVLWWVRQRLEATGGGWDEAESGWIFRWARVENGA